MNVGGFEGESLVNVDGFEDASSAHVDGFEDTLFVVVIDNPLVPSSSTVPLSVNALDVNLRFMVAVISSRKSVGAASLT